MDIKTLLEKEYVIFDGAMGTMLQSKGMPAGTVPETINFTHPEWIRDILSAYIDAGSDMVCADTFGANRYKLAGCGYSVDEVIDRAIAVAREAAAGRDIMIGLDVGPLGRLLEPVGGTTFEEAYDAYREIVTAGERAGADIIVLQTMTDLYELKAALLAVKENTSLPVICSMTFEENMRTFTGCSISSMALTLEGLGADIIGVNCSLGPDELRPIVSELLRWTTLPVMVKPNAGLPDPVTNKYCLSAQDFAFTMAQYAEMGVKVLGGCCGTTPEFIRLTAQAVRGMKCPVREVCIPTAVCSAANTVVIDRPRIIGERINPTGKKRFKEALRAGDIDYILSQASEQVQAGADILDINVGLPEIDEKAMMVRTVKAVQSITDTPLQLDSTIPEVLEAGLRVYNGKAIVNSVNGEDESLDKILPIAAKYGAAVVGLTIDSDGIPDSAEKRYSIAYKIISRAAQYGIRREDIFIDCLTLTASAEQAAVGQTLKAMDMVKERLGVKTVLGVSNISFGLPNRELINHTFLTMALCHGLDLPIINPNVASMTGVVRAHAVLAGIDEHCERFVECYKTAAATPAAPVSGGSELTLPQAISRGLKSESAAITRELLATRAPMDIINEMLIPALDEVGGKFERGEVFLPQLILTADTAGVCFGILKDAIAQSGDSSVSRGRIILATVHGDIHDIGKNIVKVLLENYGYTVIDLGKDVPEQAVVDAAIREDVHLIGLSALMTTTLPAMERTISLLREQGVDCEVMVGGAVLTPDYAAKIGADHYARDAKESVDIARRFFS